MCSVQNLKELTGEELQTLSAKIVLTYGLCAVCGNSAKPEAVSGNAAPSIALRGDKIIIMVIFKRLSFKALSALQNHEEGGGTG